MTATFILAALLALASPHHAPEAPALAPPAAEQSERADRKEKERQAPSASAQEEKSVVTRHTLTAGGVALEYEAEAGTIALQNDAGEVEGRIFSVTYRKPDSKPSERPLVFLFNGGPGSSSVWLHLGAFGPRRVKLTQDGGMPAPPFSLADNSSSLLPEADLVFVDPVGTGYSRAAKDDLLKKFTTVQGDVDSLGRFIRAYLTKTGRWSSPVYLLGESYGGFRVAGIARYLAERGVTLSGIILISPALNMQTHRFDFGNELPYPLYLSAYTATALFHGRLKDRTLADLDVLTREADAFSGQYATALFQGDRLPDAQRAEVARKVAAFTGIPEEAVRQYDLRLDNLTFARLLLQDTGQMTGFLDSRLTAPNFHPGSPWPGFDTTLALMRGPFTSTLMNYLDGELGYHSAQEYHILGEGIGRWDWEAKNRYADAVEELQDVLARNPYAGVFVASGWFDLSTPPATVTYSLARLRLSREAQRRITHKVYRGGHMMYLLDSELEALHADLSTFIAAPPQHRPAVPAR